MNKYNFSIIIAIVLLAIAMLLAGPRLKKSDLTLMKSDEAASVENNSLSKGSLKTNKITNR